MPDDDLRRHEYEKTREHLWAALHSSYEQFDKAVLTLSSALLGLSVSFIRPLGENASSQCVCLLVLSWLFLLLAVCSTISSLVASQRAIRTSLDDAYDLYIRQKDPAVNVWSKLTERLNMVSAVAFLAGAILTVVFVTLQMR
jgi:hypothetical protein